jgi:hypothetical protein
MTPLNFLGNELEKKIALYLDKYGFTHMRARVRARTHIHTHTHTQDNNNNNKNCFTYSGMDPRDEG